MSTTIKVAPPHSIILIVDVTRGDVPDVTRTGIFWATDSCLVVGTFSSSDGETEISMAHGAAAENLGAPSFDVYLETPSKVVVIVTTDEETIYQAAVKETRTRVRVWINHPTEPDKIDIVFD